MTTIRKCQNCHGSGVRVWPQSRRATRTGERLEQMPPQVTPCGACSGRGTVRTALIGAALLLAAVLTGCGVDTDGGINPQLEQKPAAVTSTAPAPVVETSEPVVDEAAIRETAFLATVRGKYPITEGLSDETLIALATAACGAFDRGATRAEVMVLAVEQGGEYSNVIAYAVGAGVAAYCPEHKALF